MGEEKKDCSHLTVIITGKEEKMRKSVRRYSIVCFFFKVKLIASDGMEVSVQETYQTVPHLPSSSPSDLLTSLSGLFYGQNTEETVHSVSQELSISSTASSSETTENSHLIQFADLWLGSTIRTYSKVIPFRALEKRELYEVAHSNAEELFVCQLCDR